MKKYKNKIIDKLKIQFEMRDTGLLVSMRIFIPTLILGLACIFLEKKGFLMAGFAILWCLSAIFLAEAFILFRACLSGKFLFGKKLRYIYPLIIFFLAIWVIRFDVAIHTELFALDLEADSYGLNLFEHILNSMVHAFQTFSMDEDYSGFLTGGKEFIMTHMQEGFGRAVVSWAYGAYCASIGVLAALAGGAVLLTVLTNAFPGIQLRLLLFLHPKYTTYVFSELNEQSILLAESVFEEKPDSILVFTDAYTDEDKEQDVEIRMRARNIRAICLEDDINILKRLAWGPVKYYLIDSDQKANIISFADFFSGKNKNKFIEIWNKLNSKVEIYVFAESLFLDDMIEKFNNSIGSKDNKIFAKPVDMSEIMSYELLRGYPLYRCIDEKKDADCDRVNILLIGDTPLIRCFIQNASWCGQFINPYSEDYPFTKQPVRVHPEFHILCSEKEHIEHFIDTCLNRLSTKRREDDLTYATFNVQEGLGKVDSDSFFKSIQGGVDYCLIDTGDDLENLSLEKRIKSQLDMQYFLSGQSADILCMVSDPELNDIYNQLNGPLAETPEKYVRRYYVGSFKERYGINHIENSSLEKETREIHRGHQKNVSKNELYGDMYNYRSSRASAVHYQYRLFSAGIILPFGKKDEQKMNQCNLDFLNKIMGISLDARSDSCDDCKLTEEQKRYLDVLFWLEKLRWNAYSYSISMREPSCREMRQFYQGHESYVLHKKNNFSNEELLLHGCLMDLKQPMGIVLERIQDNAIMRAEYESIREKMENDFLSKKVTEFSEERIWPEYLEECLEEYWTDFCEKYSIQMDILDVHSAFRNAGDYKEYDFTQIPILSIDWLYRDLSERAESEKIDKVVLYLEKLGKEGNYLWHAMGQIVDKFKDLKEDNQAKTS